MDSKLLEMLVCPVTKGPLVYDRQRQELVSKSARLAYPIRDGIPVMLEEEARRLEPAEYESAGKRATAGETRSRRCRENAVPSRLACGAPAGAVLSPRCLQS